MRCCVPSCKNDSRYISKSQGITFHSFPTDSALRKSWIQALDIQDWSPRDRSAVCSDHFSIQDLYMTRNGLRKIRSGAIPLSDVKQEITSDTELMVCRVCLGTDYKLLPVQKYNLDQAYESITGYIGNDDNLPQFVCMECAYRLNNWSRFKNKCLTSLKIMLDLLKDHNNLTSENINDIDRQTNSLTSSLSTKLLDSDNFIHIEYIETNDTLNQSIEDSNNEENSIFILEDNFHGHDNDNDNDNDNENDIGDVHGHENENDCQNGKVKFEKDDANYSSDDSLPLQVQKRKKAKKKSSKKIKVPPEPKIDRRRKPFLNEDLNETLFTITDLTFEEQVAEINKRQESANYKNAVFKCTACFKGFLDENAFNGHMTRHTDQCGEYSCEICKTHFKHPHALRKHITAHHTQRYSCNRCPYVTTHRQTARLHERWHKGTKYKCPHCMDEFVKFTTYMGHIRIKHPSDFVCVLCGYSFVSEKGIELHKKLKHRLEDGKIPDDGPFCEPCNVRFVSQTAYKRHLSVSARHNNDDKNGDKRKRGRKTRDVKDSTEDSNDADFKKRAYNSTTRKPEGPIPCEQCGLQLEDSRAYHSHFRRMHPDKNRTNYPSMKTPCMCEVCGRMFQSQALLKDHRWTHTGQRPFACGTCGKAFRMRQRLVAHARLHHAPRAAHPCALCGKAFSTQGNCQRHMFIHTGLRPFACEMCGKCFKHASEKRAHVTYVHLKKPWPKRSRAKRRDKPGTEVPMEGSSEVDANVWSSCDPKISEMNTIVDKPMYYNVKL